MMSDPTIPDILTTLDVLTDVNEISDSLTPERAIELRVAVEQVLSACKTTIGLLDQQLIKVLEYDVVRDGRMFWVGRRKDSVRFDHSAIGGYVLKRVLEPIDHDTGEILDREGTARAAIQAMSDIYLSDSTSAKVRQLDRLSIPRNEDDPHSVRTVVRGDKAVFDRPTGVPEE